MCWCWGSPAARGEGAKKGFGTTLCVRAESSNSSSSYWFICFLSVFLWAITKISSRKCWDNQIQRVSAVILSRVAHSCARQLFATAGYIMLLPVWGSTRVRKAIAIFIFLLLAEQEVHLAFKSQPNQICGAVCCGDNSSQNSLSLSDRRATVSEHLVFLLKNWTQLNFMSLK